MYKYHHSNSMRQKIDTFSSINLINISDVLKSMNLFAYSIHSNELLYTMCKWMPIFLGIQLNIAFSKQKCAYFGWLSSFITFAVYFSVKCGHIFSATIIMTIITADCTNLVGNTITSTQQHFIYLCRMRKFVIYQGKYLCAPREDRRNNSQFTRENWFQSARLLQQL